MSRNLAFHAPLGNSIGGLSSTVIGCYSRHPDIVVGSTCLRCLEIHLQHGWLDDPLRGFLPLVEVGTPVARGQRAEVSDQRADGCEHGAKRMERGGMEMPKAAVVQVDFRGQQDGEVADNIGVPAVAAGHGG